MHAIKDLHVPRLFCLPSGKFFLSTTYLSLLNNQYLNPLPNHNIPVCILINQYNKIKDYLISVLHPPFVNLSM